MPGRDKRGPLGKGAMTGRGAGTCANKNAQRNIKQSARGMSLDRGRGMGLGRGISKAKRLIRKSR